MFFPSCSELFWNDPGCSRFYRPRVTLTHHTPSLIFTPHCDRVQTGTKKNWLDGAKIWFSKYGLFVQRCSDRISLQEHCFHVHRSCNNFSTPEACSWMKEEAFRSVSGAFTQHTFGACAMACRVCLHKSRD